MILAMPAIKTRLILAEIRKYIVQNVPPAPTVENKNTPLKNTDSNYLKTLLQPDSDVNHNDTDSIQILDLDLGKHETVHGSFDACFNRIYFQCFSPQTCIIGHHPPTEEIRVAAGNQFNKDALLALCNGYFDCYLQNQELTIDNISGVLALLLRIEDTTCLLDYVPLTIKDTKILKRKIVKRPTMQQHGSEFNPESTTNNFRRPQEVWQYIVHHDFKNAQKLLQPDLDEVLIQSLKHGTHQTVLSKVTRNVLVLQSVPDFFCRQAQLDVIVRPSRILFRCEYNALNLLARDAYMRTYLFPNENPNPVVPVFKNLNFINPAIEKNVEQQEAIRHIVSGPNSFAPYIIFGPPGTGKTTTIVEAILQLQKQNCRILVTAGSNSACDTFAMQILKTQDDLLRIYSRISFAKKGNIRDPLLKCIRFITKKIRAELKANSLVVATICVVGILVSQGYINKNYFTHIFIDEAGTSTEAEALAGIMGIKMNSQCRVILSGDHKQLGPVVKSKRAKGLGFGQSMMERLLARECYAVDSIGNYDHTLQMRLRRNYRSHAEIVRLYNHLYYNNELIAEAPYKSVNMAAKWHLLPNANFPIIFQEARGKLQQSHTSPSSYNMLEVEQVLWYVDHLLSNGIDGTAVLQTDIGIITPYTCQCEIIRRKLKDLSWDRLEVGSVEMFQGREKPIIIVSYVRSFSGLGFVGNPRRLNVILSRAQSLLIMIGNSATLQENADFRFLINECKVQGTYLSTPKIAERKQLIEMPSSMHNEQCTDILN